MTLTIAVLIGSIRDERNGEAVKKWLQTELADQTEATYTILDLLDWHVPHYTSAKVPAQRAYSDVFSKKWSATIEPFDGYIFVTPEYNRGAPGVLKDAMDHLFYEWSFKPAAFIGYGTTGAFRAMAQLEKTAIELNMAPIRRQIGIPIFSAVKSGEFCMAPEYRGELQALLTQLNWWAAALKDGRAARKPIA